MGRGPEGVNPYVSGLPPATTITDMWLVSVADHKAGKRLSIISNILRVEPLSNSDLCRDRTRGS